MFTGIIETLGKVTALEPKGGNLDITIASSLTPELKIDQSVAHNGVCLTVVSLTDTTYTVTAIAETLSKTNLDTLKINDTVNLERAMILGSRLDGHIVQGHVDQTGECTSVREDNGSWIFSFTYDAATGNPTIEKGSITIDGTSLTVVNSGKNTFEVAIIPYTYEHTRFNTYKPGTIVNLEFDVIGKYVAKLMIK
ncbi:MULTISPECIES: riboflavin synthase [Maribacter]|uniref:riboflavin synthase n=1 Tax=Maribacter TaxID=252356 RepID=UPI00071991FB|nr:MULTISPECIES: riboflavin synthase [Maribacter]HAF77609.1 riboflavin synthase [Maribacter sp.]KSA12934.1 Riboflavin synthase alpha chain [Maribacter dokdonensis DSW-8]MBU2900698.1 riboflavin synthase [Maribacter dokdonensis]CAG2534790.1 riboflavin synthase alpha chain [Maribacter dokdonensis]HAI43539.1 riboflavin synthase [Maribacter sp.]|tara:strand:+ start:1052 stop:1636 length:585 start_codon:yes stop_codon:yes gene_type:complete